MSATDSYEILHILCTKFGVVDLISGGGVLFTREIQKNLTLLGIVKVACLFNPVS